MYYNVNLLAFPEILIFLSVNNFYSCSFCCQASLCALGNVQEQTAAQFMFVIPLTPCAVLGNSPAGFRNIEIQIKVSCLQTEILQPTS